MDTEIIVNREIPKEELLQLPLSCNFKISMVSEDRYVIKLSGLPNPHDLSADAVRSMEFFGSTTEEAGNRLINSLMQYLVY